MGGGKRKKFFLIAAPLGFGVLLWRDIAQKPDLNLSLLPTPQTYQ